MGHLAVARHARAQLGLERVLLMPASVSPHKPPVADPGPSHRLRMCELAVAPADGVLACGLEVRRGGTSYTVDTLEEVHAKHPDARLTFIVGADTALTLCSWRRPRRIVELARLAVAMRAGCTREDMLAALAPLYAGAGADGGVGEHVDFLSMPPVEASSSQVRARVARGQAVDELVGAAVAGYIAEHRLYAAPIGAVS